MEKIIGALKFKIGVYADVKKDTSFTATAWLIVAVTAILSAIGSGAILARGHIVLWLVGAMFAAAFAVLGFALACLVIGWVGRAVFNTTASFDEVVRPLGLARIWHVVGFLGIITLLSPSLRCVSGLFTAAAGLLGLVAWVLAVREALALDWAQAIAVVVLGMIVVVVISIISASILGAFGIFTAALTGSLTSVLR